MNVYGTNPVAEALRSGRVRELRVATNARERQRALVALAGERGVPVRIVSLDSLDRATRGGVHQGVSATVDDAPDYSVAELVSLADGPALVVVLDGVEDPQNLGAILRTADAAGASGVVVQDRRSAALDGAAAKAAAGAASHVRVARVVNVVRAIDELKTAGVWVVGLSGDADLPYDSVDLSGPVALVLGAEGTGLRRLVRESCDFLVGIPIRGHVGSLNVSVAAGVALFEAVRQRGGGARRSAPNTGGRAKL